MMKKAIKRPLYGPRRTVKRGAPPIIKPRRAFAKSALVKARLAKEPLPERPRPDEDQLEKATFDDEERVAMIPAEEGDDTDRPEKPEQEERDQSNFLAMYFKEMAELDVLRPEEEFRQAKDIETLEITLWDKIFSFPPVVEHVLKVIERSLDNSLTEFRPMRKALSDQR